MEGVAIYIIVLPAIYVAICIISYPILCIPAQIIWEIYALCFNGNVYSIYYESDDTILRLENQIKKLESCNDNEPDTVIVNKILIKEKCQYLENYKREENRKLYIKGDEDTTLALVGLTPVIIGMITFCMYWNVKYHALYAWVFALPFTCVSTYIFIGVFGLPILDLLNFLFKKIKMRCTK